MKDLLKNEAGFTLLELIVVVAVIGILAAIIVPQVNDIRGDADENSVKSSLASIQTALERYNLDSDQGDGEYPSADGGQTADGNTYDDWADAIGIQSGDYSYSTSDQSDYSVHYTESFDGSYYYVSDDRNGLQSTNADPTTP